MDSVPEFTDEEDSLVQRWSNDGKYFFASIYKTMVSGGKLRWNYMVLWRCYAPSKVKIFTFLWLNNKILTREMMLQRNMQCDARCPVCSVCTLETIYLPSLL